MNFTKKIAAILSAVLFTVMFVGCGTPSPKKVVDNKLKSIQQLKKENLTEIIDSKKLKDSKGNEL